MIEKSLTEVLAFCKAAFLKMGVSQEDTTILLETIEFAHQRGKGTHGLVRMPIYAKKLKNGFLNPKATFEIIKNSPLVTVADANHGFGQIAAYKGMQLCIDKAKAHGVGVVSIRKSNNFGTAGFFAEMAAKQGMISIVMGNASPAIAPTGGAKALLGTNPIGLGFPTPEGVPPIVLDMATSQVARGKIRLAAKNGEQIPLGWAIDSDGNATSDPIEAIKGAMMPLGGAKGYGLSLAVDILAGLLSGAAFGGDVKPLNSQDSFSDYGHFLVAINISFFMEMEAYLDKIMYLINSVKATSPTDEVLLPGEGSYLKQFQGANKVSLKEQVLDELNIMASSLGIQKI